MNRYAVQISLLVLCLLLPVTAGACSKQALPAKASDSYAGSRAELVSLGDARLHQADAQQVTVHIPAGTMRIVAQVGGADPALECKLLRLEGDGDAAHWRTIPLKSTDRPASDGALFALSSSSPLEPGTYRLSYTGRGWLKTLNVGAGF